MTLVAFGDLWQHRSARHLRFLFCIGLVILMSGFPAVAQENEPAKIFPPTASEREAGFMFRQGLELLVEEQFERAGELFRQALRLESERLEIRPYLAKALFETSQYEAALRQLELYLEKEPTDYKVAFFRVRVLTALDRFGQASDALNRLRYDGWNESWEWHNLKGYLEESQEQWDEALESYRRAAELTDDSLEPRVNMVSLLLRQEQTETASVLVAELLDEAPENLQVLNAFALLLAAQDRGFDPSLLMERLKEQTLPFELQYNLVVALLERNEVAPAAVLSGDLVDRYPDDARAEWLYGRMLLQRGEVAKSGDFLVAARDRLPVSLEILATMGQYTFLSGDFEGAAEWYAEAIKFEPDDALLYHNRSMALTRADRLEEAILSSSQAYSLDDEDPRIVYQLALALDRTGSLEEAAKYYRRFMEVTDRAELRESVREHLAEMLPSKP